MPCYCVQYDDCIELVCSCFVLCVCVFIPGGICCCRRLYQQHANLLQALKLLQRLATPGDDPTANGGIRQQVKMIASIGNPHDWHKSGKLSMPELRLLEAYNAKPVLMRPCQRFYRGHNYLEIDFDLHSFTYFARKVRFDQFVCAAIDRCNQEKHSLL